MLYPVELQTLNRILDSRRSICERKEELGRLARGRLPEAEIPTPSTRETSNLPVISLALGYWDLELALAGVADGTRTRNNQNHNLGLYH
jgi:hypothetical protein